MRSQEYYEEIYSAAQRTGLQGFGNSMIDRAIVRDRMKLARNAGGECRVLELGTSSGEHLTFEEESSFALWVGLDLFPGVSNPSVFREIRKINGVNFTRGDVERITFQSASFNQVISTCVLHHLTDPETCLREVRRVVRPGGIVVFGVPTDPGVLNRAVKSFVTYRQMRKAGDPNPRLSYAREHSNHFGALKELFLEVFRHDSPSVRYWPFRKFPSWNANLLATFTAVHGGHHV